ncbi:MAG: hypothetical protein LUD46_03105 [Parabacteroides sp.]|nr:hypothetical protein [Parabacteroides sp.]
MKHLFLLLTILLFSSGIYGENKVLFEIGRQDNSAAEFALYPDNYKSFLANFGGEKSFYVGYSTPEKHWPYVLPGPLDDWAGGGYWAGFHPRHFPSIYFNLGKAAGKGECSLTFFFTGAHNSKPIKIRVEVNGHRFEEELNGENAAESLENKGTGKTKEIHLQFPASWLTSGMNKIQLGTIKGTWAIFDCIRLETPAAVQLGKASSSLIRSVKAAPFEYQKENGERMLPVLVDMNQFDTPGTLTFMVEGCTPVSRTIEVGESIQEILIPAAQAKNKQEKLQFTIRDGKEVIYKGEVIRSPQRLHSYSDDVDLLMGTGNSRWMFKPGPSLPLSMVQIAPDNQDEIWKAGYEYTIENIMGFNHFSDWTMTGFLMQPTCGELKVNPDREDFPDEGYRSRIDKSSEKAEIGKYSVYMTDTKIQAGITATRRAALQRYVFPAREDARILIDMFTPNEYPHNLVNARVTKVSDTEIEGYATYYNAFTGYTLEQSYTLYFVFQFSKPFDSMGGDGGTKAFSQ